MALRSWPSSRLSRCFFELIDHDDRIGYDAQIHEQAAELYGYTPFFDPHTTALPVPSFEVVGIGDDQRRSAVDRGQAASRRSVPKDARSLLAAGQVTNRNVAVGKRDGDSIVIQKDGAVVGAFECGAIDCDRLDANKVTEARDCLLANRHRVDVHIGKLGSVLQPRPDVVTVPTSTGESQRLRFTHQRCVEVLLGFQALDFRLLACPLRLAPPETDGHESDQESGSQRSDEASDVGPPPAPLPHVSQRSDRLGLDGAFIGVHQEGCS